MDSNTSAHEEEKSSPRPNFKLYINSHVLGLGTVATSLCLAYKYGKCIPVPASLDMASKLGYTAKWMLLPSASVFMAVMNVAIGRGKEKVWPLTGREHLIELQKNICANTVEQSCVFSLGLLALGASVQTPEQMRFIPTAAMLFFIGRILFMVGYSNKPEYRGFGMSINFALDYFTLGAGAYLMCKYGLSN